MPAGGRDARNPDSIPERPKGGIDAYRLVLSLVTRPEGLPSAARITRHVTDACAFRIRDVRVISQLNTLLFNERLPRLV